MEHLVGSEDLTRNIKLSFTLVALWLRSSGAAAFSPRSRCINEKHKVLALPEDSPFKEVPSSLFTEIFYGA